MNTVSVQAVGQVLDQVVERGGADRIEARGRLVQEQQLRIERQGAGQAGPLDHAAGELGGLERAGARRQPDQRDLEVGQFVDLVLGRMSVCSNIGAATFSLTVRFDHRAPCWNSTPQRRSMAVHSRRRA